MEKKWVDLSIKEQKELSRIIPAIQKLHQQLQKSSYYNKQQTYSTDDEGDEIPDDYLLEMLLTLNSVCVDATREFIKKIS
jgi:hypothetical protein